MSVSLFLCVDIGQNNVKMIPGRLKYNTQTPERFSTSQNVTLLAPKIKMQ